MPSPPLVKSSLTSFHMAAPMDASKGGLNDSNMESSLEDPFQDSGPDQIKEASQALTGTPPGVDESSEKEKSGQGGAAAAAAATTATGQVSTTGTPPPPKGERFHAPALSSTPKTESTEYVEQSQGDRIC